MACRRPEYGGPPEIHYDEEEARQYTRKSRIAKVQTELTERAVEIMSGGALDENQVAGSLILDVGCGSGLSGNVLSEHGFRWVGVDISSSMLQVGKEDNVEGDLLRADIGYNLNFRPASFDGAVSISVVQWLCHSFSREQDPRRRLRSFFVWLYRCLNHGAKAVLQFYPSHEEQKDMIGKAAIEVGFTGGFVVDNPESQKKRRIFLVLAVGVPVLPQAALKEGEVNAHNQVQTEKNSYKPYGKRDKKKQRENVKGRSWILAKKEQQRQRGMEVRPDTRYTGRKRKVAF